MSAVTLVIAVEVFQTVVCVVLLVDLIVRISKTERQNTKTAWDQGRLEAEQAKRRELDAAFLANQQELNQRFKQATQTNERTQHDAPVFEYDDEEEGW